MNILNQLISEAWIEKAIDREYELHPHTASGWIRKGGRGFLPSFMGTTPTR